MNNWPMPNPDIISIRSIAALTPSADGRVRLHPKDIPEQASIRFAGPGEIDAIKANPTTAKAVVMDTGMDVKVAHHFIE